MTDDGFANGLGRQRPGECLAERHQLFEFFGPRARQPCFRGRRRGFSLHLAPPRVLMEHEHDRQDEQRRAERHAVDALDVGRGVENIEDGTLKNDDQREDKAREQKWVLTTDHP